MTPEYKKRLLELAKELETELQKDFTNRNQTKIDALTYKLIGYINSLEI